MAKVAKRLGNYGRVKALSAKHANMITETYSDPPGCFRVLHGLAADDAIDYEAAAQKDDRKAHQISTGIAVAASGKAASGSKTPTRPTMFQ